MSLPNSCPFDAAALASPPAWLYAAEAEPPAPAYIRRDSVHFRSATPSAFLPIEFNLRRLEAIEKYLWLAGRPMPARPLHAQLGMNRSVVLTEQLDMHLLWQDQQIFLKPLPQYLLRPSFWQSYFSCGHHCSGLSIGNEKHSSTCSTAYFSSIALGFLLSWVSLIQYESDLRLAQESHLIPKDIKWPYWHSLVSQLVDLQDRPGVHVRWIYGELRLHRINSIYRFMPGIPGGSLIRGYRSGIREYRAYVEHAFAYFFAVFGVLSIMLNAFQVGLGTSNLSSDARFQNAAGGFVAFALIGILGTLFLIALGMLVNLAFNLGATLKFRAKRRSALEAEVL